MAIRNKSNRGLLGTLSAVILKLIGWKIVGELPDVPKFVIIAAPHTSNIDFPIGLMWMYASGLRINWVGKHSLFESPLGGLYYRLGGIPVKRDRNYNFVDQMVDAFDGSEMMKLAITPEGTRSKSSYWKSGFYYIACGADVPIVMAFFDYPTREVGIGGVIEPCGDIQTDFEIIQNFYSGKRGRYPSKQGEIELKPETSA